VAGFAARVLLKGALFVLILTGAAPAQSTGNSFRGVNDETDTLNYTQVLFNRLLSTYRWQGLFFYGASAGDFRYDVRQLFRSSLVRTTVNLITDEETFTAGLRYLPGSAVEPRLALHTFILSDRRGLGVSDVAVHSLHGGVALRPARAVTIAPHIGFRVDRQIGITDRGVSTLLEIAADSLLYEGYHSVVNGMWQYDRLDPRTLETRNLQVSTVKIFPGNSSNAFNARYFKGRRDFYTPADAAVSNEFLVDRNIETRTENGFVLQDSLLYRVGPGLALSLNAGVFSRGIERSTRYRSYANREKPILDSRVDELSINGELSASYSFNRSVETRFRVLLQERNETHVALKDDGYLPGAVDSLRRVEERKNNVSKRTSLTFETTFRISSSDTVSVAGSGTLLRYDTPSEFNTDDRDDLWYVFNLSTRHRINRYLHLRLRADVSLTHLVYISSKRSADNTWNRIFRLSPVLEYSPSDAFSTTNRFEVLANYTVYDFEIPGSPVRSFSFRQFALSDSSVLKLSRRTSLGWKSHVRIYERGNLRWEDFTERPVNSFEDFMHWGEIRYRATPLLIFSLGIRYFSQLRFGYIGENRVPERYFRSIGPTTGIEWSVSNRTALSVRGWYERQSRTGLPENGVANMSMSLNINL
jgi:hypothetical protein